jgi:tellurite resistance protein TerC
MWSASSVAVTAPVLAWLCFGAAVVVLLALDVVGHRHARGMSRRATIGWSVFWIAGGLAFAAVVWKLFGRVAAEQYLAAYAIEKSLSIDNLFLFLIVFRTLGLDRAEEHRALTWGIVGAIVFRAAFVWLGLAVLETLHWAHWLFGGILLVAAVHAVREHPDELKENKLLAWLMRKLPVSDQTPGEKLFVREGGRVLATPLLVAIITIELADVAFAVDSVPAALAVSNDPFVVYTSNIFALLGLRALYSVLATTISGLAYLHYGIAGVLAFAAVKMIGGERLHISPLVSALIVVAIIGVSAGASLVTGARRRTGRPRTAPSTS